MQTKAQVQEKIDEMIKDGWFLGFIRERTDHFLSSGAVDFEDFEDNYVLPKAILTVCLERLSKNFVLDHHHQSKRLVSSLRNF